MCLKVPQNRPRVFLEYHSQLLILINWRHIGPHLAVHIPSSSGSISNTFSGTPEHLRKFITDTYNIKFNPIRTKLYLSDLKTQSVPHSKHSASVIKADKLKLYREMIAVCSEIHANYIKQLKVHATHTKNC
jgi:hypothetical protein